MNTTIQQISGGQYMVWLASEYHPINFALMARIRGAFTPYQFQKALYKLQRKYPPLSTRVIREAGDVYVVSDPALKFPVRIITPKNAESWIEAATAALSQAFDLFNNPPLHLVWLQYKDVSELLFICLHVLADGLSIAYLVRDFLTFLNDSDAEVTPMPLIPPMSTSIPEFPGKKMVIQRAKLKANLLKLWLSRSAKQSESQIDAVHGVGVKYHVRPWVLTAEQTSALVARSRAEGTTVHASLCAAFLRAFGEFYGDGWKRRIQSPVSLRDRLSSPVGESFGLFVNLVEFCVNCTPQRNFWEVARKIKKGFNRRAEDKHIFNSLIEANVATNALRDVITPKIVADSFMAANHDLSISNLGRLDIPLRYGALHLEALFGPILGGNPEDIVLGVTTIGGKMHLSLSFTDLKLTPAQAEKIIASAMHRLADASNW
ncbi:MAG: condensation domain-containing protein [Anaerolineae bacterium]